MNLLAIQNIPCWLIPLVVGVLCAILGYLLGKLTGGGEKQEDNDLYIKIEKLETSLKACSKQKTSLQKDLEACNASKLELESKLTAANEKVNLGIAATKEVILIPFDADAAKAAFGKKVKQDDLKIVEGIGPKIEGLFHNFGIKTWKDLGETSVEKCQEVLHSGGERYRVHKPDTWPAQSKLAYEGKWEELVKWQDKLDGGKA